MIEISVEIEATPERVWAELSDLASHHQWMAEAGEIVFETDKRAGLGTRMLVPTRVGPLTTLDELTIVEWEEGRVMGVAHVGAVSGTGRFVIDPAGKGTRLVWTEELTFPWYLAGPIGVWLARPILKRIWRNNLSRLARRVKTE